MKYKVGDRVRIVSETTEEMNWASEMDVCLGRVMTIKSIISGLIFGGCYIMAEDKGKWFWDDGMIAGLASETPFDFKAWENKKFCMHCRTEEEAEDFCDVMNKAGLRWSSGNSYLSWSCFEPYKEQTCYCFNEGTYDSTMYAMLKGYTILEWSDYRSTEPLKEEQEKTMETKIDDKPLSFQEAMKIKKRICETTGYKCENCCITSDVDSCNDFFANYADEIEPILKEWAAEHPVKTNRGKLIEVFGEIQKYDDKCKNHCSTIPCKSCNWWKQEYVEPYKEKE
nr:MAG TPA: Mind bomb SH3 repeat domain [Caudoviricetes sp.]